MNPRITTLINDLRLAPHPEGGHFSEVYRSALKVHPADGRDGRSSVTSIYFLLQAGERGRWHVVHSDEIWHYYEGDPLELHSVDPRTWEHRSLRLGPEGGGALPVHVIPAGCWQAARTLGAFTLVGCTVAPGFEYRDYRIFEAGSIEADEIRRRFPDLAAFL